MFTGLIEEVGRVIANRAGHHRQLQISAPRIGKSIRAGDSVAVNGCCLTVASRVRDQLRFDLLQETLKRTNLNTLRRGDAVNLERPLRVGDRLGGHFVQGHIDCIAQIRSFEKRGADHRLEIELPARFARYVVEKGGIAVDGISLTIAEVLAKSLVLWNIPHTKLNTNLARAKPGDRMNIEFDVLAKYVERALPRRARAK
jgi:riboflavin synthase